MLLARIAPGARATAVGGDRRGETGGASAKTRQAAACHGLTRPGGGIPGGFSANRDACQLVTLSARNRPLTAAPGVGDTPRRPFGFPIRRIRLRRQAMTSLVKFALLAVASLLAGCQPAPEPLRIVSSPWAGYEPLYLARDLDYLKETSVRITELPSSNITLEAFSNGSADIATLTLDETLTLLAKGQKLRILLVMDISNGADAVVAKPGINSLAELKGKRLGMENIPLGVYILSRVLEMSGLKAADIDVIPMPEDKHEKAYLQGKIDAAITMEPYKTKITKAGAHVLLDSSQLPNEIFDLVLVREDVYKTRRNELCQLAREWFRTLDYVQTNPQDAIARMSKRMGTTEEDFRTAKAGIKVPSGQENQLLLGGNTPTLLVPARRLADVMLREHMIPGPVDVAASIDPGFASCLQ
jgi:NitT/TauT family transport system substrate-binding protein